jgi:hypothetical protein
MDMFQSVRITTHDCQKDFSRHHLDSRHSSLLDTESQACPQCTGRENRSTLTGTLGSNSVSPRSQMPKTQRFLQNPRVSLGVLCVYGPHFWLHGFALCRANPRKPYGTIGDTSAQLTAPFSGVFRHPADLRNRWITRAQRPPHQQIPSRRYRQSGAASYVRQKHDSCVIISMHRHRLPATCRSQPVWKHRKGQSSSVDGGGSPS